jgi:sulfatase modifying factor 1
MADIEPPEFAAFMSYTHFDDAHHEGYLTAFRELLSREVQAQTGREFPIFQDRENILWGDNWTNRIENVLNAATFLIAIITPSFFSSDYCRRELESFAKREEKLGRDDIILPIYFLESPSLETYNPQPGKIVTEAIIASRQWIDWRDLRFEPLDSAKARKEIARIARQLKDAISRAAGASNATRVSRPEPHATQSFTNLPLRAIPPGSFWMGTNHPASKKRERPVHYVTTLKSFFLSRTPITVQQFEDFVRSTGYKTNAERRGEPVKTWHYPGFIQGKDHPVVCVTWFDALEFCLWLSAKTGKSYRLPTEAEWEFSCRAGSDTRWFSGDYPIDLKQYAWLESNSENETRPVALKSPNSLGLYDLHGNIWEWCQDWFGPYTEEADSLDPKGPQSGIYRIARGGSWIDSEEHATSSFRCRIKPFQHANNIGFRVAVDP